MGNSSSVGQEHLKPSSDKVQVVLKELRRLANERMIFNGDRV